jgi:hypothetical protein
MVFLFNQPKSKSLTSFIQDKVNLTIRNKSGWTLYIMTCYITISGLDDLFIALANSFEQNKLIKVKILVDKDEWAKLFFFNKERVLKDLVKKLKNINENVNISTSNISVKPVESDKLFHAKSFALINDNFEGFIISTSANLTERGLSTNLEFGNFVQNSTDLNQQYVNLFSEIEKKSLVGNEQILRDIAEAELILSMGVFYIQRNDIDTICSRDKSEEAVKRTLRRNGVNNDSQSISYRLIDHIAIKKLLPPLIPSNLIKYYSIETIIGRWIPKEIDQIIEKRKNMYGDAYIDFMKYKYFNPESIKREKKMLTISIENNIKNREVKFNPEKIDEEQFKNEFIDDCINKAIKAKFIQDDYSFANDKDSVLNILFDYHKIEEIEFEEIPNNFKKVILKEIRNSIDGKNLEGFNLKKIIHNTSNDNHLNNESFKRDLDIIAESFKIKEGSNIKPLIKNLKKGHIFSALVAYNNKKYQSYEFLVGCIFESHAPIDSDAKNGKVQQDIKAIKYYKDGEPHVESLLIDNIILFNKFDEMDKRFYLPLFYLEQQFQELIKKFDEDISKIVLRELDYVLKDSDRKKFFLLALELKKSNDKDSNTENFVLDVAHWYYGLQDNQNRRNIYNEKNLADDIKSPELINPHKFSQKSNPR